MKISVWAWLMMDVLLFVFVQYLAGFDHFLIKIMKLGLNFMLHLVGAIMAFVILQKIANRVRWENRYFNFVTKRSMAIYLLHQQVVYFFIIWLNGAIHPWLHAGINFVGVMMIVLVLSTILQHFKWTRFLIGER